MTVHEDSSNSFAVYDAAPENQRDKGQFKRMVSFFFVCFCTWQLTENLYPQTNMPYFV